MRADPHLFFTPSLQPDPVELGPHESPKNFTASSVDPAPNSPPLSRRNRPQRPSTPSTPKRRDPARLPSLSPSTSSLHILQKSKSRRTTTGTATLRRASRARNSRRSTATRARGAVRRTTTMTTGTTTSRTPTHIRSSRMLRTLAPPRPSPSRWRPSSKITRISWETTRQTPLKGELPVSGSVHACCFPRKRFGCSSSTFAILLFLAGAQRAEEANPAPERHLRFLPHRLAFLDRQHPRWPKSPALLDLRPHQSEPGPASRPFEPAAARLATSPARLAFEHRAVQRAGQRGLFGRVWEVVGGSTRCDFFPFLPLWGLVG